MYLRALRTALVGALALAACSGRLEEPAGEAGDALTPKRTDLLQSFTSIDLQQPVPTGVEVPENLWRTLSEGSGEAIRRGMIGRFHYVASLANGAVFHDTYQGDGAEPQVLRLLPPAVPEGLALGLEGCRVGERRLITVPSRLGFGDTADYSHGAVIPARSVLIYDIQLVEVVRDLAIKIVAEGTGPELRFGQTGRFYYTGVLASDGSQFDATDPGEPRVFSISSHGVIAGWRMGLPGMKVGERRWLRIPSALAYGEQGNPPRIGPNADLVFEVELVEILP